MKFRGERNSGGVLQQFLLTYGTKLNPPRPTGVTPTESSMSRKPRAIYNAMIPSNLKAAEQKEKPVVATFQRGSTVYVRDYGRDYSQWKEGTIKQRTNHV